MSGLFARHKGAHVRRGSSTGWAGTARQVRAASEHPVTEARFVRPTAVYRPQRSTR